MAKEQPRRDTKASVGVDTAFGQRDWRSLSNVGLARRSSPSPVRGKPVTADERRLVTVLFADVVGSTRLSRNADPEQVQSRIAHFFDLAREQIDRFGGTVEGYQGDSVMAIFGLPVINEDDPERAVRAAAGIRSSVSPLVDAGMLPGIRIGVDTGEIAVHERTAGGGERLVTGMVLNLASRLQQHAAPGQVLIGERTMQAVRNVARLKPVQLLFVKGVDGALHAWELLDVSPPRDRGTRQTAFVGREEELRLLVDRLHRTEGDHRGHLVTICGAAGVGKTRLVHEFRAHATETLVLLGRALPYGTGVPFWALGQAIRGACDILPSDPLDIARLKLQETSTRLEVTNAIPAVRAVLGLDPEGRTLPREELFAGTRSFFHGVARRSPLVLILEDMHAAEDVTLDYLEQAADWLRGTPQLVLVLCRPSLLERRPNWMHGKDVSTTLRLDPLDGDHSHTLVKTILGGRDAPGQLIDLVLERAQGNPLFIEEMLWTLREQGALVGREGGWAVTMPLAQITLPDTVHAVIAARIDALPSREKQVLRTAAVVGKEFWAGALRLIADEPNVDDALQALVGKDLLVQKPKSALSNEREYGFRHVLIRDVAYGMLAKAQRWPKHARLAEWLQHIAGDRQSEYADLIAHHWLQVISLQQDLAAPRDPRASGQAIANLILAGDRAARVYANETALDHYTRALALDPPAGQQMQVLFSRASVRMLVGEYDQAREDLTGLRTLAERLGDLRWEASALDHLGLSYRRQGQVGRALDHLQPALALSRQTGDPALTGRILHHIGLSYYNTSRLAEAIAVHEEARKLFKGCGDLAGLADCLHGLGECCLFSGRFKKGIRWLSESAAVSEQIGNRSLAGENRHTLAFCRIMLGEYEEALAEAERGVVSLMEIGDAHNLAFALGFRAGAAGFLGRFDAAFEYATRGLELARQIGAAQPAWLCLQSLGVAHREIEDFERAWEADRQALELARTADFAGQAMPFAIAFAAVDAAALGRLDEAHALIQEARGRLAGGRVFPQEVTLATGRVLLALGRVAEAREAAASLSAMVDATGTMHWRVPAALLAADSTALMGHHAEAVSLYETAGQDAEHCGRTPALWRALAGLSESQLALGRATEAAVSARRASDVLKRLASAVSEESRRTKLLESTGVRRVRALAGT